MRAAGRRSTELEGMLAVKGQEIDSNCDRASKLQHELESSRVDAEGMLQVMLGMERQIAELSVREASTIATVKEGKQSQGRATGRRSGVGAREPVQT